MRILRKAAVVAAMALLLTAGCGDEPDPNNPWNATTDPQPPVTEEWTPPQSTPAATPSEQLTVPPGTPETLAFPIEGKNPSGNSTTTIELPELKELWSLTYTYDCTKAKDYDPQAYVHFLKVQVGHNSWIVNNHDKRRGTRKVTSSDVDGGTADVVMVTGACSFTVDVPASSLAGEPTATVHRPLPATYVLVQAEGAGTNNAEYIQVPQSKQNLFKVKLKWKFTCSGLLQFQDDPSQELSDNGVAEWAFDGYQTPMKIAVRANCPWTADVVTEPASAPLR